MEILDLTQETLNSRYLGLPGIYGEIKDKRICIFKGESLETNTGMEGEMAIKGR
jgi:hypothetical protein